MKKAVNLKEKDDGNFFISIEDFLARFENVTIALYNSNWTYSSLASKGQANHSQFFTFEVK